MRGVKVKPTDSVFLLADVLTALGPMLEDSLFWVGDFEPGWWTSPEARAWVTLMFESGIVPGAERPLLTYTNILYFVKSSLGMGEPEVRIVDKPTDVHRNNWAGYFYDGNEFELGFEDSQRLADAVRLLESAGYSTSEFEPHALCPVPPPEVFDSSLLQQMIWLVESWDLDAPNNSPKPNDL